MMLRKEARQGDIFTATVPLVVERGGLFPTYQTFEAKIDILVEKIADGVATLVMGSPSLQKVTNVQSE